MGPFSPDELRTLAVLAETFVPTADGPRIAALAAEALVRAADPDQVRQLRLVLGLLETPLVNLLTAGRWRGLSRLPPRERERLLLRWAHSPIDLKRSGFQAFRKLLSFLAYAVPAPDSTGRESGPLSTVDYRPDGPPTTEAPTPVRVIDVDRSAGGTTVELEADVIVVGSGAGGGVVAAELAAAGRSVLVLEAGPFVDEATMPRTELDAFSRLYLNHGLLTTWDASISLLAGSAVGGGTVVNWTTSVDIPRGVRREWARDHGLDGVDGSEWAGDREAIERELGVAPAAAAAPKDAALSRGATTLGWEVAPTRRNAVGCDDCGACPFGCPRGTKQSGLRVHLAAAVGAGARIVDRVRVTRLLLDGDAVAGVDANLLVTDPATGMPVLARPGDPTAARSRRLVARARQVVLAAGALRSPQVLQQTGPTHRAVGRYLRLHPVPVIAGRYAEPIHMWRGVMQAARSAEFTEPAAGREGYVIESAPGHPGLLALALPWDGATDHADWLGDGHRIGPLIAVTRDGGSGRVSVTPAGRVRIDYELDDIGVATLRHALGSMARIARAAGAVEIAAASTPLVRHRVDGGPDEALRFGDFLEDLGRLDFGSNRGSVFSAHQMGTVRMGAEPAGHAADERGRVRGPDGRPIRGLYVADSSTFPTGIGVNPMLAVMTMARRVARTVRAEGRASG
ncbi:MAG: GMC family oxidoreductase N-terminal domain-containing protein [Chloroflexota bacterium]